MCVICYSFLLYLFLHFFNTHGSTIIGYAVVASQPYIYFFTYMLLQSKVKLNKIKYYLFTKSSENGLQFQQFEFKYDSMMRKSLYRGLIYVADSRVTDDFL